MIRTLVALGAAVTTWTMLVGCAAPASDEDEEEMGEASDAFTAAPVAQCSGNGNLRAAPTTGSAIVSSVGGTPVNVYCKTHGLAPPALSDLWIGVNVRQGYALRYMHASTLACGSDVALASLRECSTLTQVPPAGGGAPSGGGAPAGGGATLRTTKVTSNGAFSDSVAVGRTGPGTVSVTGRWSAYDATGREVGRNVCTSTPALYSASFTGPFTCYGDARGATRFEITYTATAPGTLSR